MLNFSFWFLLGLLLAVGAILNLLIAPWALKRYYYLSGSPRQWWNHSVTVLALTVGVTLIAVYRNFGSTALILLLPVLWLGPLLFIIDAGCQLLPNRLTLPFGLLSFLLVLLSGELNEDYSKTVYAILVSIMVFIVAAPLGYVRGGIGGGDLKLLPSLIALTVAYSWHTLLFFIIFTALGAGGWALLLLLWRRASRHAQFAFGPWLLFATYLAFLV